MDLKANLKWSYYVRKKVLKNHNVKEGKRNEIYTMYRDQKKKKKI